MQRETGDKVTSQKKKDKEEIEEEQFNMMTKRRKQ